MPKTTDSKTNTSTSITKIEVNPKIFNNTNINFTNASIDMDIGEKLLNSELYRKQKNEERSKNLMKLKSLNINKNVTASFDMKQSNIFLKTNKI